MDTKKIAITMGITVAAVIGAKKLGGYVKGYTAPYLKTWNDDVVDGALIAGLVMAAQSLVK
jgi:tetrahydromethanopterin S-methyltransferase subunit D